MPTCLTVPGFFFLNKSAQLFRSHHNYSTAVVVTSESRISLFLVLFGHSSPLLKKIGIIFRLFFLLLLHTPTHRSQTQWQDTARYITWFLSDTTTVGDWAFPDAAARTWNSLPAEMTSSNSLQIFKTKLKSHLFLASFPQFLNCYSVWSASAFFTLNLM